MLVTKTEQTLDKNNLRRDAIHVGRLVRILGEPNVVGWDDADNERVVKSASRALRILELFDVLRRNALVSEVSDLLDLPQSSTSVLLRSLVVCGYLSYNPTSRAYGPTTRVALLGSWINGPMLGDGPLMRLLESLGARTGLSIVLAVRNQIWSQYIHVVQATSAIRLFVVKGSKRPLARSSTGLMLLAGMAENEVKRIGTRYNSEVTDPSAHVGISCLLDQVRDARSNGYALSDGLVTPGAGMLAMPLPQMGSDERFVIGVGGAADQIRERKDELILAMHEEIAHHLVSATVAMPLPVALAAAN